MNRQERAAIWRDELAHPNSPTTRAAMTASGAEPDLVEEWADLEGNNEPSSDWMVYEDFIKGAIGIATDHDSKGEFDTPQDHARRLRHLLRLWGELAKVTDEPHNEVGENRAEHDLWQRRLTEASVRKAENERLDKLTPSAVTECIFEMEGELYCRFNPHTKTFLGFGYTPTQDAFPALRHLDGPEFEFEREDFNNPVWQGMREYLQNVYQISGEYAMAVQWTEDGWRVK